MNQSCTSDNHVKIARCNFLDYLEGIEFQSTDNGEVVDLSKCSDSDIINTYYAVSK